MKRLIFKREVLRRVGLSYPTIWKMMRQGRFPRSRVCGGKSAWLEHEIESWIESREAIPVGSCWDAQKQTRMSNLEVVPHPDGMAGDEVTEEQADQIVDEMFA